MVKPVRKTLSQIKLSDKSSNLKKTNRVDVIPDIKKSPINFNIFKDKKDFFLKNLKKIAIGSISLLLSILISYFLFPENIGLFTIILTTLFLMPYIYMQSQYAQLLYGRKTEIKKDGVSIIQMSPPNKGRFRINKVYEENRSLIDTYLLFFIGIFITISLFIFLAPFNTSSKIFSSVGWDDNLMPSRSIGFENQDKSFLFKEISLNNLSVIFVCFIFAIIFPSAGILIIVWNAVFWGVIFTQYTLTYSLIYKIPFSIVFLGIFWSALPHIFLEATSYFFSAVAGVLFGISIRTDFKNRDRLTLVLKYCTVLLAFAIIFVIIGTIFEIYVFDILKNLFFSL